MLVNKIGERLMVRSWKDQKDELCNLIKQVSDAYGGDEKDWLRQYAKDILEIHKEDLDKPILALRDISRGIYKKHPESQNKPVKTNICPTCLHVAPFCRYDLYNKCSNANVP
jgi:hypothetical protein